MSRKLDFLCTLVIGLVVIILVWGVVQHVRVANLRHDCSGPARTAADNKHQIDAIAHTADYEREYSYCMRDHGVEVQWKNGN